MEIKIEEALQQAVEAHKAGRLQDAERLYRAILQTMPEHPDANHNLGVMAVSLNKTGAALPLLKRALEANPSQGQFWLSYIDALIKEKQFDNARNMLEQGKKRGLAGKKIDALEAQITRLDNDLLDYEAKTNKLCIAIELREEGKYQEAQEWLNNFLDVEPRDAEGWSLLSQVYLLDKRDVQAEEALAKAISINPNLPSVYRNQARLLLKKTKPTEALEKAKIAFIQSNEDPESLLVLAACLGANQKDQEALPLIEKALKAKPNYAEAFANRGMVQLRAKNITSAIEDLEKALSLKAHLVQLWGLLGSLRYQSKNLSGAIEALKKANALEPTNEKYMVDLGEFLRQDNQVAEAISVLAAATKLAPENANAWTNLGNALQQATRIDDAKEAFAKALVINTKSVETLSKLGMLHANNRQWEIAKQYFDQVLEINPDSVEMLSNVANLLQELGRLEDAETSYKKAIALKPDFAEAHSNLGNLLQKLGRLEDAEISCRKAIALKPDFAEAHSNLGSILKARGTFSIAEASYRQAIALKSDYAEVHNNLGNLLQELGRFEDAEVSYRNAIAQKPDFAEAHSNLGNTLQELGRFEDAETSFRRGIALKPDFTDAHYNLGEFLYRRKKYGEAAEHFKVSNYWKSQSYLLMCFYRLDEQSLFYDQLDYLISQGLKNALIGALGCRAAIRYGVARPNLFCNDPLSFVLKADLTKQYDFKNTFVRPALAILSERSGSDKFQPLIINGRQTRGNLFGIGGETIDEIKRIINLEVEKYRVYLKDSDEGLIKNWPTSYSLYGWLISMKSGGELHPHIHENGWLSGSIYINVPPKSKTNSGNLVVCIDDEEDPMSFKENPKKIINVVTGSLCLFPASLLHYTIPFESEEERIVLAFDVVPK